jgi:hypothetical protein
MSTTFRQPMPMTASQLVDHLSSAADSIAAAKTAKNAAQFTSVADGLSELRFSQPMGRPATDALSDAVEQLGNAAHDLGGAHTRHDWVDNYASQAMTDVKKAATSVQRNRVSIDDQVTHDINARWITRGLVGTIGVGTTGFIVGKAS